MRPLWVRIHRWLGLGVALFFGTAALTGAALVYENELDILINRAVYETTPGDVGAGAILGNLASHVPGTLVGLRWPLPRQPVYTAEVRAEDGTLQVVQFDPGTGNVITPVRRHLPIMSVIRRTHTTLLAGRPGHYIVLSASLLGLISLATGLILWWPGIRRIVRGFSVRTRRGFYPFTFDAHQVMGAIALPLLFIITLTGVLASFQPIVERVIRVVAGERVGAETWQDITGAQAAVRRGTGPEDLVAAALAAVPDGEPLGLRIPRGPDAPAVMDLLVGEPLSAGAMVINVRLDPADGRVLKVHDPRQLDAAARVAGTLNLRLHIGAVGGPAVRALYTAACLIGVALTITGLLIWWTKRQRSEEVQRRNAAGPATLKEERLF